MLHAPRSGDDLADWEIDVAEQVARRAGPIGLYGVDDLTWLLLSHWIGVRGRYREAGPASQSTWMRVVLVNKVNDLVSEQRADKRGGTRRARSLDAPIEPDGDRTLGDIIADDSPAADPSAAAATTDLQRAVRDFQSRLPARLRIVVDAIEEAESTRAAARQLGMPPSTLYARLAEIRHIAEAVGLRAYL